jgi:hypothetical protein
MPRTPLFLAITLCVSAVLAQAATPAHEIVPAGTLLQCTIDEPNFSSKTAMVGDPVLCHLGALRSFGHSVFPRGAMLSGHLQDYKDPGHFVGKGWMQLEFDRIVLPNAEVLPLSAKIVSVPHLKVDKQGDIRGGGHVKRDIAEWMIPVLWPIKILNLPARGPYPTLKGEARVTLRLMEDIETPYPVARNSVPMPPWATPQAYGFSGSVNSTNPLNSPPTIQPAVYSQKTEPAPQLLPSANSRTTIIALKGGAAFVAQQYWIASGQMHCVSTAGKEQLLPLDKIDLAETVRVNQERNVEFTLQSRDVLEQ